MAKVNNILTILTYIIYHTKYSLIFMQFIMLPIALITTCLSCVLEGKNNMKH